jgi:hypothetical protein
MKKTSFIAAWILTGSVAVAQTNALNSTGNVGIGTLSPAYPLDVQGNVRIAGQLKTVLPNSGMGLEIGVNNLGNASITNGYTGMRISANLEGSTGEVRLIDLEHTNSAGATPNNNGYLFHSKGGVLNVNSYVTVPQTGGIVIGRERNATAIAPFGGLQIPLYVTSPLSSQTSQGYFATGMGSLGAYIENKAGNPAITDGSGVKMGVKIESSGAVHNISSSAVNYGLYINAGGADINYSVYVENGNAYFKDNIGVGTSPVTDYKLAVNGSAIFNKIKVKQYPWADYVFAKDYHLPSLSEVEAFIRAHGHLPDVVSAEQVEKEGLDVGENQAVLLKKIEELTLYMIELNKRLDKLEAENRRLKKRG